MEGKGQRPRRAEYRWISRGLIFGAPTGPLSAAAVNDGHPRFHGLYLAVPVLVLVLYSAYVSLMLDVDRRPWRVVAPRAAGVLFGGSVLFLLPRVLTLSAAGGFWEPSELARFLVCCTPYPLLGLLVGPGCERRVRVGVGAALAATVLAWPLLMVSARDLAAEQVRIDVGAAGQLPTLDTPAAYPAGGYVRTGDVVWMSFDSAGANAAFDLGMDYNPDDLDMYVFPISTSSPCGLLDALFENTIGFDEQDGVCTRAATNLWVARNTPEDGAVTEVEEYRGFYVALSVDSASTRPVSPSALTGLFATLHPADDSELVSAGVCACSLWAL